VDDKSKSYSKPKSPVLRIEKVKAACGHLTDFEVFDDKKDQRFREQRRAKTASRPCLDCRQKAQAERIAQAEKSRVEKANAPPEQPKKKEKVPQVERRLPNGSTFNVTFDAAKMEWSGKLTIPEQGEFTAVASGVFRLLERLDRQYWKSKEQ
jgi:hypothetical protein